MLQHTQDKTRHGLPVETYVCNYVNSDATIISWAEWLNIFVYEQMLTLICRNDNSNYL